MRSLADRFPRPRALRLAALAALVFAFGSVDVARGADAHGCPDVTVEGIAITSIKTDASCEGASEVINAAFAYAHNCRGGCLLEAAGRTWEGIIDSKGELSRTPGVRRHRGGFGTFDGLEPAQRVDFVYFTKYTVARKHYTVPCRYWDDSGPYALLKVEPRKCTLGGTYGYQQVDLVKMRWRSWVGDSAYGRGISRANMGVSSKVRVKLYRPRLSEENTYRFTRARFNFGYGWSRPLVLRVN
jgi:hypothetical protein